MDRTQWNGPEAVRQSMTRARDTGRERHVGDPSLDTGTCRLDSAIKEGPTRLNGGRRRVWIPVKHLPVARTSCEVLINAWIYDSNDSLSCAYVQCYDTIVNLKK